VAAPRPGGHPGAMGRLRRQGLADNGAAGPSSPGGDCSRSVALLRIFSPANLPGAGSSS